MRHAVYSLILGAVVSFNCGALYWLSLQAQPVSGGLTRIGELPESDYGFNAPQMRFKRRLSVAGIYERPCDVVVIGDSFCETPEGGAWVDFLVDEHPGARQDGALPLISAEDGHL